MLGGLGGRAPLRPAPRLSLSQVVVAAEVWVSEGKVEEQEEEPQCWSILGGGGPVTFLQDVFMGVSYVTLEGTGRCGETPAEYGGHLAGGRVLLRFPVRDVGDLLLHLSLPLSSLCSTRYAPSFALRAPPPQGRASSCRPRSAPLPLLPLGRPLEKR